MNGDYRKKLMWNGFEHDESEYDLVLMNLMNEHDRLFIGLFTAWVKDNLSADMWESKLSDLWYEFVRGYVDEHDMELLDAFKDEIEVIE